MAEFEKLSRVSVPELDAILGEPFKVLDDGFVRVIDYLGSDESVVQAARVSYGKGTKKVHEDRGLIRYLMRHSHTTPLEMCEIKLHVRTPIHVFRQWIRHRTASVNEYSTRYSEAIDSMHRTLPGEWRFQSSNNRQGSAGNMGEEIGQILSLEEDKILTQVRELYEARLSAGVAREQARKDLPLSTYTEAYWKIDLHNLLHFLRLRMDSHAQKEIREFAIIIGEQIVSKWAPLVWEAFEDYRLGGLYLTRLEVEVLQKMFALLPEEATEVAKSFGWLKERDNGSLRPNRERSEFVDKLKRLGADVPWIV